MERQGFTERAARACARRPWATVSVWLVVIVACGAAYFLWGGVFTSSTKFLADPDSKRATDLIAEHGGGSVAVQAGAAVQSLAEGIGSAKTGAGRLAEGTEELAGGTKSLQHGLGELAGGAGEISAGTRKAAGGAGRLSEGISSASAGASSLSAGLSRVDGATGAFNAGLLRLSSGGARLVTAADRLAAGAGDLAAGAKQTAAGVSRASSSAGQLSGGAQSMKQLVDAYLAQHPEAGDDPTYQQIVGLAAQLASGTGQLAEGLASAEQGSTAVASGAGDLASGAGKLASGARDLSSGLDESAGGAGRLSRSIDQLSSGGARLAGGLSTAAQSSRALASGQERLAAGTTKVAKAARRAAGGAREVAQGTTSLNRGASSLENGLTSASAGATALSDAMTSAGSLTDHDTEIVVVRNDELTVDDAAYKTRVLELSAALAALPGTDVVDVVTRYDDGLDARVRDGLASEDGHTTLVTVEMNARPDEAANHIAGVRRIVEEADGKDGFDAAVTGSASFFSDAQDIARTDLERGEAIGVPVALVILVLVFGTLVAAGVPLVLSIFAIVLGLALTVAFGHLFDVSIFALNVLTAMGLAVGIDYSLFIVSRYREERAGGLDKLDAIGAAAATASNAVFFSGMTVVLAMVGMLIVPLSIFTSLGLGAMAAVFGAVLAALTLLPAILSLLGDRIDSVKVPFLHHAVHRSGRESWWARAARTMMKRPAIGLALGAVLLLLLAAPALLMKTGGFSAASFPDTYSSKQGLTMLQRDFPAGLSQPVTVAIDGDLGDTTVRDGLERLLTAVGEDGRFTPLSVQTSADGSLAVVRLVQDAEAMTDAARANVLALRDGLVPEAFRDVPASVYVGGQTAGDIDSTQLTESYMWVVIAVVLSLSFVLLLVAFRSVVVSLSAIVMNLLSVGASYGVITLVFQKDWGASLVGLTPVSTIESWVPLLMFCVLFGLSMDYQVFLLSRIREAWGKSHDSRDAVVFGVQSTASIITGAAMIMVAVFAGMASGRLVVLQQLGLGLAVAVLLDAFVVRTVVAPAMIALIGERFWWMPRWLGWLPRIGVEGPAPDEEPAPPKGKAGPARRRVGGRLVTPTAPGGRA